MFYASVLPAGLVDPGVRDVLPGRTRCDGRPRSGRADRVRRRTLCLARGARGRDPVRGDARCRGRGCRHRRPLARSPGPLVPPGQLAENQAGAEPGTSPSRRQFGWTKVDDWFNGQWRRAKTIVSARPDARLRITFSPLTSEFPEERDYDVTFRRTLGLRLEGVEPKNRCGGSWSGRGRPRRERRCKVELNAGGTTPAGAIGWDGYNARVRDVHPGKRLQDRGRADPVGDRRAGRVRARRRPHDAGPSLQRRRRACPVHPRRRLVHDLAAQPRRRKDRSGSPRRASSSPRPATRRRSISTSRDAPRQKTIAQRVKERPEQSYATRVPGPAPPPRRGLEPRVQELPAAVLARSRTATSRSRAPPSGRSPRPTPRGTPTATAMVEAGTAGSSSAWKTGSCRGDGTDPAPALVSNLRARKDDIELEQTSLAAPLDGQIEGGPIAGDRDLVCLVRFRLRNVGAGKRTARLHLEYSSSQRAFAQPVRPRVAGDRSLSDWLVPNLPARSFSIDGDLIRGDWHGRQVLRARVETPMTGRSEGTGITFTTRAGRRRDRASWC